MKGAIMFQFLLLGALLWTHSNCSTLPPTQTPTTRTSTNKDERATTATTRPTTQKTDEARLQTEPAVTTRRSTVQPMVDAPTDQPGKSSTADETIQPTSSNGTQDSIRDKLLNLLDRLKRSLKKPKLLKGYVLHERLAIQPPWMKTSFASAVKQCSFAGAFLFGPGYEADNAILIKYNVTKVWVDVKQHGKSPTIYKHTLGGNIPFILGIQIAELPDKIYKCPAFSPSPNVDETPVILEDVDCKTNLDFICAFRANDYLNDKAEFQAKTNQIEALKFLVETTFTNTTEYCTEFLYDSFFKSNEQPFEFWMTLLEHSLPYIKPCNQTTMVPPFNLPHLWNISLVDIILTICTVIMLFFNAYILYLRRQNRSDPKDPNSPPQYTPSAPVEESLPLREPPPTIRAIGTDPLPRKKVHFFKPMRRYQDWDTDSELPPEDRI